MIEIIFFITLGFFLLILILLVFILFKKKSLGSLSGENVYIDTRLKRGDILYSNSLNLKGKPDYILKDANLFIPVEVKTGKTPAAPYRNHIMQLAAYCALIEETYQIRPPFGVVKYPEREFKVEYTKELENKLKALISEIINMKETGFEPKCNHPEHN